MRGRPLILASLLLVASLSLSLAEEPGCAAMSVPTLYDMPVSNNGARCRIIIYKKGLTEQDITILHPSTLGGLKSPEYLALNPQGKMPLLTTEHGAILESDTIARYLLDRFSDRAPSFAPATLQARVKSDLICRLHDIYVGAIQGCMYKPAPPFGIHSSRQAALADLKKQLLVINDAADETGPFLTGPDLSLADATLFPTLVFVLKMLPKFAEEPLKFDPEAVLGAKVFRWWTWIQANDEVFARVFKEVDGALQDWDAQGRWDTILFAGKRDDAAPTIFDRVVSKQIPSEVVMEDEDVMVFKDIHPQAPTHLLIIPKQRNLLPQLRYATADHAHILAKMNLMAAKVAAELKLGDFRLVINDGADAQQSVFHVHMHLLAGRKMQWPPG